MRSGGFFRARGHSKIPESLPTGAGRALKRLSGPPLHPILQEGAGSANSRFGSYVEPTEPALSNMFREIRELGFPGS